MLTLCGCGAHTTSNPLDAPSAAVSLPATCEKILKQVPLPAIKPTDDARVAFLKDDAALITANGRIGAGHDCVADQRRRYAGTKEAPR